MAVKYVKPDMSKKYNLYWNMHCRTNNPNYYLSTSYEDVEICEEWQTDHKAFYAWVDEHYYVVPDGKGGWESPHLDKDINYTGEYSPKSALFVPKCLNDMFTHIRGLNKNGLSVGVSLNKKTGKYIATICLGKDETGKYKKISLGTFLTPEEAHAVWVDAKKKRIKELCDLIKDYTPDEVVEAALAYKFD